MVQQNEPAHSLDPATVSVKRKRGRPRKEDIPGTEPSGRTQQRRSNPPHTTGQCLVGQPVSGILDGVYDTGFMITVRVGNGHLLQGMVFDSQLSVPVSAENDVAPHIKMSKRDEIPITAEPLQKRGSAVPSPIANKAMSNYGSQWSDFRFKRSEDAIWWVHSIGSKEAGPIILQFPDSQRETGGSEMYSSRKGSEGNGAADDPNLGCISQTIPEDEAAGKQKPGFARQTPPVDEATGELKLSSTSQTLPNVETAGEMKLHSTSRIPPGTKTECELKVSPTGQATSVDGTVG